MAHARAQAADRHRHRPAAGFLESINRPVGRLSVLLQPWKSQLHGLRLNMVACPAEMASTSDMDINISSAGFKKAANPVGSTTGTAKHTPSQPHSASTAAGQIQPARGALKQCLLLGAAALCAAPLILLLDIAERASLALCQLKQIRQHLASVVGRTLDQRQECSPMQSTNFQPAIDDSSSNHSSSNAPRSRRTRPLTAWMSSQRPADLWLLDLYPPFAFMALAVLPLLLLAIRHWVVGTNGVLQPMLWCLASLMVQACLNLFLAVRQRFQSHAQAAGDQHAAAVAAGIMHSGTVSSGAGEHAVQCYWWQPAAAAGTAAAAQHNVGPRPAASSQAATTSDAAVHHHQQQQHSRSAAALPGAAGVVFRVVQICGDAFRCGCICSIAMILCEQQIPAAFSWTGPLSILLNSSSRGGLSVVIGAASASVPSLQQGISSLLWRLCDGVLCGGCLAVYVLAFTARLLPSIYGSI